MKELGMHLEKEQAFYEANKAELRSKYAGKRVVIATGKVLGIYDSDREAIQETSKTLPRGSFMVKYIPVDPQKEILRLSPIGNIVSYGWTGLSHLYISRAGWRNPYTGINGESLEEVAIISIRFPNGAVVKDIRVAICGMSPEYEMIIGMDVITQLDFAITNGRGQTQFSFAIPPFEEKIDFCNR